MERDVTGLAVQSVLRRIENIKALMRVKMPYGPDKVHMTPAELSKFNERLAREQAEKMFGTSV